MNDATMLAQGWMQEFRHDQVITMTPLVRRLTAPNPGYMTGPGTNTYLVGHREVAVIDPGIVHQEHISRLVEATGGRLRWILATHTHPDHSPAAVLLAEQTGATTLGHGGVLRWHHDATFQPHRLLTDGDVLSTDEFTLQALYTPGHASNHLCYLLHEEQILFAGDQVMEGTTVVIGPPDGDMADYLSSLERLKQEPIATIAPAHGRFIGNPQREFNRIISHRLERERQVYDALLQRGSARIMDIVGQLYTHLPEALRLPAAFSVYAHLLKLHKDGLACGHGFEDIWSLPSGSDLPFPDQSS